MAGFPSWFGKNSKQNRVDRILQELQKHMRISISANKIGVGMDYLSVLKSMLSKPLIKKGADGIPEVLKIMQTARKLNASVSVRGGGIYLENLF